MHIRDKGEMFWLTHVRYWLLNISKTAIFHSIKQCRNIAYEIDIKTIKADRLSPRGPQRTTNTHYIPDNMMTKHGKHLDL